MSEPTHLVIVLRGSAPVSFSCESKEAAKTWADAFAAAMKAGSEQTTISLPGVGVFRASEVAAVYTSYDAVGPGSCESLFDSIFGRGRH